MKLTKKYCLVSVSKTSKKIKKSLGEDSFPSIKKSLDKIAERVGSVVKLDKSKAGVTFYLSQRPRTRQGRLNWNKEVDRLSTFCNERLASYSSGIIVGRTGNQLELRRRNA